MFAARNRVKLPGGCVNGLCQVHYRSRLDIIDLEMAMLGMKKKAEEPEKTNKQHCFRKRWTECVSGIVTGDVWQ